MGQIYRAIDVDKMEHDILKVTFNAHSSNNGDITNIPLLPCILYYQY